MTPLILAALACVFLSLITWSIRPARGSVAEAVIAFLLFIAATCLFGALLIGLIDAWKGEFLR